MADIREAAPKEIPEWAHQKATEIILANSHAGGIREEELAYDIAFALSRAALADGGWRDVIGEVEALVEKRRQEQIARQKECGADDDETATAFAHCADQLWALWSDVRKLRALPQPPESA